MSEYKRLTVEECADLICSIEKPLIICHIRPDGDTLGSAKALATLFRMLGKEPRLACSDEIPERLEFITGTDRLTDSFEGLCPVAIDVASPKQIGGILERLPEIALTIDHHEVSTPFSPHYTVAEASSAAEALMDVIDLLRERGLVTLTKELAAPLYAAISSDTGCFCYSNVSPLTHMRAAELLRTGIDAADINHRLFHTKSEEQIKAEGFVGASIQTALDGRAAYAIITHKDRLALGVGNEHFECAIDVVRTLKGAEVAFTLKEQEDGVYKASLRSTGIGVADIAALFGGGGHAKAAGCSVKAGSPEEARDMLLAEIEKAYKQNLP